MKITIICVGKSKDKNLEALEKGFQKRIGSYADVPIRYIKESKYPDPKKNIETESDKLLETLKPTQFVILLDKGGKQLSSEEFAKQINNWMNESREITFVIGGTFGVSQKLQNRADYTLSLSKMTFTHLMVRPFLLEQIYRAFTIIKGKSYHY